MRVKKGVLVILPLITCFNWCLSQIEDSIVNKKFQSYFQSIQIESNNYLGYQFFEGGLVSLSLNHQSTMQVGVLNEQTALYRNVTVPLRLRHKLAKNLYLFYGARFDNTNGIEGSGNLINSHQMFFDLGLQYDVSNRLMLELGASFMLTNPNKSYRYQLDNSAKSLLKLGAGYKF